VRFAYFIFPLKTFNFLCVFWRGGEESEDSEGVEREDSEGVEREDSEGVEREDSEGVEREDSKGSNERTRRGRRGGASASTGGLEGKPSGFNFLTHFSICHSTFNMSLISRYRIARGASEIGGKGERGTRRGREREGVRDRRVSQKGDLRTYEEKVLQIS
jgi:hypothetical protein